MSRSIEDIRASGMCSGCGLCAGLVPDGPISMEESPQGFLRPRVSGTVDKGLRDKVNAACPAVTIADPAREADGQTHPTWGPVADLRFSWATDPELRHLGSSGAGLSAMLAFLVESGKVDFVVATAMSPTMPTRNKTVLVDDLGDIKQSAGSRYAPSAPLSGIGRLLEEGRTFAFVGKPCDVAALRQLARIDERVDRMVPWMFAFFCAGVPSYRGTDALLRAMGVPPQAELASFRFRGEGWPGFAKAVTTDGTSHTMDYDTSWGTILTKHVQLRCRVCPDGTGEFADIAFADGWHVAPDGKPLFEEADGRSLTVMRKAKAVALVDEAIAAGYLAAEPAELAQIVAMQPHQALRKALVPARLAGFALAGNRLPRFRGLNLAANARRVKPAQHIRNLLGTFQRLLRGRKDA